MKISHEVLKDVCALLGIDPTGRKIKEFHLHLTMDKPPTVEIVEFPYGRKDDEPVTAKYRIEHVETWAKAPFDKTADLLKRCNELERQGVLSSTEAADIRGNIREAEGLTRCPSCHGTRQYQPLVGPAEPCQTCCGNGGGM